MKEIYEAQNSGYIVEFIGEDLQNYVQFCMISGNHE